MESSLVLEDQPSANCLSQARGFTFGKLGASGLQRSKTYRAFYKLRSIVSVTYLLDCRTCNLITCLFDCCKILSMLHDLLVV